MICLLVLIEIGIEDNESWLITKTKKENNTWEFCSKMFLVWQNIKWATYGIRYNLTFTRSTYKAVLNKGNAINIAKIEINAIELYVPQYKRSISNQAIISKKISHKVPTELQYIERSVSMKEVKTKNLWTFQLGTQEGMNVSICFIVAFQQQEREHSQTLNNDTF